MSGFFFFYLFYRLRSSSEILYPGRKTGVEEEEKKKKRPPSRGSSSLWGLPADEIGRYLAPIIQPGSFPGKHLAALPYAAPAPPGALPADRKSGRSVP
jgi:hypothetical protein